MKIAISELPTIIELLLVHEEPYFVVLMYDRFVRFVAATPENRPPDIVTVLDLDGEHVFIVIRYDAYRRYVGSLDIDGHIDEEHYLKKHGDVHVAVQQGMLESGTQHYIVQGYFERREVRFATVA